MKFRIEDIVGGRILIMDENLDRSLLMKAYFLRKKCKVFVRRTLEDVLRSAGELAPDCVIVSDPLWKGRDALVESILAESPNVQMIVYKNETVYDKAPVPR